MPSSDRQRKRPGVVSAEELTQRLAAEERGSLTVGKQSDRYPERHMPIAGGQPRPEMWEAADPPAPEGDDYARALARHELFSHAREHFLEHYGYNTARAYWGDLDDLFFWCEYRGFDIFDLTEADMSQYKGLMRRRKYSENTIRRRAGTYRLFRSVIDAQ